MPESVITTLIIVASVAVPVLIAAVVLRSVSGVTGTIKEALPGTAVVRSIADTGTTISSSSVGAEAPVYRIALQVSPPAGAPYDAEAKQAVPRIHVPFLRPGVQVPVDIDSRDGSRVKVSWARMSSLPTPGDGGALAFVGTRPVGGLEEMLANVRSGAVPANRGSAAALLATGTHGTAEITSAMPIGKRARDVFADIDPSQADDPLWMFTVSVQVPGQQEFPAVFGQRVPRDRVAQVGPGLVVPVAVDLAARNTQVAIDWDRLPR